MLISEGEGNANLARYRDVPDSPSTISNTLLLLLHDTTFAEPCLFQINYTGCTFFSTEITLNVSSNLSMTIYLNNIINLHFFYQIGHQVKNTGQVLLVYKPTSKVSDYSAD